MWNRKSMWRAMLHERQCWKRHRLSRREENWANNVSHIQGITTDKARQFLHVGRKRRCVTNDDASGERQGGKSE